MSGICSLCLGWKKEKTDSTLIKLLPFFIFILKFCQVHISKTILAMAMKFRGWLQLGVRRAYLFTILQFADLVSYILWRPVHLSMLFRSSIYQYSTQYSFQAWMNPVTMTTINPWKEYLPSLGSNQRPHRFSQVLNATDRATYLSFQFDES